MADEQKYFSEAHVIQVAENMSKVTKQYEQLFNDFSAQVFVDIVELEDASETMAVCIDHLESAITAFQTHFPNNSKVACQKGCHHCCSFPIQCPPHVIIDIARYLQSKLSNDEYTALYQKMSTNIELRKNTYERAQCPFLNNSGTCTIYQKRPLSCRSFTSPDSKLCEQSVTDGRNIPQQPIIYRLHQAVTTALLSAAKKKELFHEQVLFIPSLLEILDACKSGKVWKGYRL